MTDKFGLETVSRKTNCASGRPWPNRLLAGQPEQRNLSIPDSNGCPFDGSRRRIFNVRHGRTQGIAIRRLFRHVVQLVAYNWIRGPSLCVSLSRIRRWSFDAPGLRTHAWKINCGTRSPKRRGVCGAVRANSTGKRDDGGGDAGTGGGSRFCKRAKVTRAVTNVQKTFWPGRKAFHASASGIWWHVTNGARFPMRGLRGCE